MRYTGNEKEYAAAYYHSNKEKIQARAKEWDKANTKRVKTRKATYYKANKESTQLVRATYYKANKDKIAVTNTKWVRNNLDKSRSYKSKWKKANPELVNASTSRRRARKLNAPGNGITGKQWKEIINSTNGICVYCQKSFEKLTLDHVIPLDRGGAHDVSNAVAACGKCNSSKGSKLLSEWKPVA